MQRPWPPPLREKHTTATLHHSPSPFDNTAAATAGAAVATGTSQNKGDANCEGGSARVSAGVTQNEKRARMGNGNGSSNYNSGPSLPPLFFVLFFYLGSMSGSSRLVIFPSPDLLKYFNVIVIEFYRIFIYNIPRVIVIPRVS
jgi:hypothetical protein